MVRTRILAVLALAALAMAAAPAAATAAGGASSSAPAVAGGWSPDTSSYIGKYKLVPSATPVATTPTQVTSPAAGVFSLAIRTAAQLSAAAGPISSGQLVTFLRKVKTGEPLSPSGILSLFGASGTRVLYLTDLGLHGSERTATVDGGSFLGVPIGTFTATAGAHGTLDAVIKASGLGTAHVRLLDFVATPPSS